MGPVTSRNHPTPALKRLGPPRTSPNLHSFSPPMNRPGYGSEFFNRPAVQWPSLSENTLSLPCSGIGSKCVWASLPRVLGECTTPIQ